MNCWKLGFNHNEKHCSLYCNNCSVIIPAKFNSFLPHINVETLLLKGGARDIVIYATKKPDPTGNPHLHDGNGSR